jgi:hypothetical protein
MGYSEMRRWVLALAASGWACSGSGESEMGVYYDPTDEPLEARQVPTFEEFEAASAAFELSANLYLVEWDLPIHGETALRAYYDAFVGGKLSKASVRLTPNGWTGDDGNQCNVNPPPANCVDNKWYQKEEKDLRYCVDDEFGSDKATVISALAAAGNAWKAVAHVNFRYVSTHDSVCSFNEPVPGSVDFMVNWAPFAIGACAFYPYGTEGCGSTNLEIILYPPQISDWAYAVTHEFGHVLGLQHEHTRPDVAESGCQRYDQRYLTPFDDLSIMKYHEGDSTGCGVGAVKPTTISQSDGLGMRKLYGMPPSFYVTVI